MLLRILYENYGFNIEKLLIKEYEKLNLTNDELIVLLIFFASPSKKNIFSITDVSKKSNKSEEEINKILNSLLEKKFLRFNIENTSKNKKREICNLEGTFNNIMEFLKTKEKEKEKELVTSNTKEAIEFIELKNKRLLNINELERIRLWYDEFKFNHIRVMNLLNSQKGEINIISFENSFKKTFDNKQPMDEKTSQILDNLLKKKKA